MAMSSYSVQYGAIAIASRPSVQPVRSASLEWFRRASSSTQPNAAVRTAVRHAFGGPDERSDRRGVFVHRVPPLSKVHSSSRLASVARMTALEPFDDVLEHLGVAIVGERAVEGPPGVGEVAQHQPLAALQL